MTAYLLPGICGLLTGIVLRWTGLSGPDGLQRMWGLRRSAQLRSALYAVGASIALTALLSWLAVIDVDRIAVLPLHGGVLLAGAVFGAASGLCGFTPLTAFAGLGGPRPGQSRHALEALCTMAGCFAGTLLLPALAGVFGKLAALPPQSDATLFRITLDEPWLLGGGFTGHAMIGGVLMLIAACIPRPRVKILTDEELQARASRSEPDEPLLPPADEAADDASAVPDPEDAPAGTFVALLPGEEPLVVDTALSGEDAPQEDSTSPAEAASQGESDEPGLPDEPASQDVPDPPDDKADED